MLCFEKQSNEIYCDSLGKLSQDVKIFSVPAHIQCCKEQKKHSERDNLFKKLQKSSSGKNKHILNILKGIFQPTYLAHYITCCLNYVVEHSAANK